MAQKIRQSLLACARFLLVAAMFALCWSACAAAQAITEFPVPTANSQPSGITTGPDGALWFTEQSGNKVGRITTAGGITEFPLATASSNPSSIAAGPDGALWFTANGLCPNRISGLSPVPGYVGRITTAAAVSTFSVFDHCLLNFGSALSSITLGPDGALWFVVYDSSNNTSQIERLTTAGANNQYPPVPGINGVVAGLTAGPDGALWFAERDNGKIGRIATDGTITEFPLNLTATSPNGIAAGPDGALWFTDTFGTQIGRITTAGAVSFFSIPTAGSRPSAISAGPDGALWFLEPGVNQIGRITTAGVVTEYLIPSANSNPTAITAGPNGAMWFTEGSNFAGNGNKVAMITVPATMAALTVSKTGSGSGQVASNPAGISCGASCNASFAIGTQVTLTATATAGSVFSGWSGGGCSGTAPCTLTLGADTAVAANFNVVPSFMLSVAKMGNGAGTVASNPSGVNCGPTCNASFLSGTQVTLTASAAAGSVFSGWSGGGCSGTAPCTLTLGADTTVVANFAVPSNMLTVAENGNGSGQVTSNPAGISCSASNNQCAASFATGSQITLSATAAAGSVFSGWSGGCTGTSTCQVTLNADTTVTATFSAVPSFMLSVAKMGSGFGTITSTPSGINCGPTCNASFTTGTQVVLTATAASGSTFAGWSGGGCSGITCSVTMTANTTVTPTFVLNSTTSIALQAAVLPLSRSVQVGAPATAFASILNAGPGTASTCTIAPATPVPANFAFQTTNPSTNALTGTPNTPADIAEGTSQSFVFAFTPTASFAPTDVLLTFACANASPAPSIVGIDTLNLSASTSPVPDIVALAASGDPGYVDIPGATGTGIFAVATVNLGSSTQITASANTGSANLPVTLLVCQTDPASGLCLAPPQANVTTTIATNATPTFGVFAIGSAAVPDSPGVNRAFVTFTDANGVLRGETSVAVRTH